MSHFMSGTIQRVGETYDTIDVGEYTVTAAGVRQLSTETYQIAQVIVGLDYDSTAHIYVGNASVQCFKLEPGAAITIPIDQLAKGYGKFGDAGGHIFWLAVRDA
jgi:hypothetical protein